MNNGTITKDLITEIVINMGDIFEVIIIIKQKEKVYIVYLDSRKRSYIQVRGEKRERCIFIYAYCICIIIYIYRER